MPHEEIYRVEQQDKQRDDVFRVVVPELAVQAIDGNKTECGACGNGYEADQNTGAAHAFQKIQRRQAPDDLGEVSVTQKTGFGEINEAQDKRQCEGGVSQDAERNV